MSVSVSLYAASLVHSMALVGIFFSLLPSTFSLSPSVSVYVEGRKNRKEKTCGLEERQAGRDRETDGEIN